MKRMEGDWDNMAAGSLKGDSVKKYEIVQQKVIF